MGTDYFLLNVNLRSLRINKGLSRSELAKLVGVSSETIRLIEVGSFYPSLNTIVMLCLSLNCNFNDLVTVEDARGFQYLF